MRKKLIFVLFIFLMSISVLAENVMFTLHLNRLSVANSFYKERYGSPMYSPEGKISVRVLGNIYLWGSFAYISSTYKWEDWSNKGIADPDIEGESILDRLIFSGGLGYYIGYMGKGQISIKFEAGLCNISHSTETNLRTINPKELISSDTYNDSGIGGRANLGFTYGLLKKIYGVIEIGFIYVPDTVNDETSNLGGFRLSMGLGLVL
jgi:hypothetical protein